MASEGYDPEAAFLMQMKAQHESDAAEINESDSKNDQDKPLLDSEPVDFKLDAEEAEEHGQDQEDEEEEHYLAGEDQEQQEGQENGQEHGEAEDVDIMVPDDTTPTINTPRRSASLDATAEYDPASAMVDNAVIHSVDTPASSNKFDEEDVKEEQGPSADTVADEYDPESTSGPFVIDDDDVDDPPPPTTSASATPTTTTLTNAAGHSPNGEQGGSELTPHAVLSPPTNPPDSSNLTLPDPTSSSAESKSPRPENPPSPQSANADSSKAVSGSSTTGHGKRKRLPQDIIGQLEDRIAEDPRGDTDAWLALISEHQKKGKLEDTRTTYERFLKVFPTAAEHWVAYCQFELTANDFYRVEQLFNRCLLTVSNVELWGLYLGYIRRRNNLSTDASGKARSIVSQAYEFVLNNIGIDRDSGRIWRDYVDFIKSGPGNIGGSGWQDQQKMDHLRKVYQRVICIPVTGVEALWKEYDSFEMGLNKITGRKFLQEKSPSYMTARSSLSELRNLTNGLIRTSMARLPPAPGFDGYEEYMQQVELWKKWIAWEKGDPLVLEAEDAAAFQKRIIYVYKQALMALRFWPEIWFEASNYHFSIKKDKEAVDLLKHGMVANPESCLLSFRYAEYLESSVPAPNAEDKEAVKRRSAPVRQVYDDILDVYYKIVAKIQAREAEMMSKLEESGAASARADGDDDDDDDDSAAAKSKEAQITALKEATKAELLIITKTISAIWINLMKAMRRIEGHGKVGDIVGGSRQIFADARKKGKITSDVYVASALMEYHCYKDPSATRIFDRGMKVFADEEGFHLEYLKFLISVNDITNARSVFETFVGKFPPEKADQARRVYGFFYEYESQYGELHQIKKLESRMRELFPNDPQLRLFSQRYAYKAIDPSTFLPVVSPTQLRPKMMKPVKSAPMALPDRSPKRLAEDSDGEFPNKNERPRKIHRGDRGESPLKGAAGRRLDQQKRANAAREARGDKPDGFRERDYQQKQIGQPNFYQASLPPPPPPPAPLPDRIMLLLSIIPPARSYNAARFSPEGMVKLFQNIALPSQAAMPQPAFGFQR